MENGTDLVIGSRVLGRRERGALLPQARLGNALATLLIRLLYGVRYTDLGPFRAVRWSALGRIAMRDTTFGWTCEMQVKAARLRLAVTEVPVSYRRRIGVSKIAGTFSGTIRAGWKILWTVAKYTARPGGRVAKPHRAASAVAKPHPPAPSPGGEGEEDRAARYNRDR